MVVLSRLGGGPNELGSFRAARGALWWAFCASKGSLLRSMVMLFRSDFHESRWMALSPLGCHPSLAIFKALSMTRVFVGGLSIWITVERRSFCVASY